MHSYLTGLSCRACCRTLEASRVVGVCPACGHTLFAEYDLKAVGSSTRPETFRERPPTLWKYSELLPLNHLENIVSLGEGMTPILPLAITSEALGVRLSLKDDGQMPTGSFKARGMAVAISKAKELGVREAFVPSAGNAGLAFAAYVGRAGIRGRVYFSEGVPPQVQAVCESYGAEVSVIPGTISDAGRVAREREKSSGALDLSTLREPYRVEGKKTMGLEIFEQSTGGALPDAIVYPTGGGTGLVGMFKAFTELRELGWLERFPRLIAVQAEGCAPVVRAIEQGASRIQPWENPATLANGLLVPSPFASERILEAIRATRGGAVAVSDREIVVAMAALARKEGVCVSPEGAATFAAVPKLTASRQLAPGEEVLLYNTGSGVRYSIAELERVVNVQ